MTEQGPGWTSPGGEPQPPPYGEQPGYGPPPGYAPPPPPPPGYAPPPGYSTPPPGYAPPPGYGMPPGYGALPPWQGGPPPPPVPGVVPLRPLGLGELLDGSVKIIRRYARPTLGISAMVAVVGTILNVLVVLASDYSEFDDFSTTTSDGPSFNSAAYGGSSWVQVPAVVVSLVAGLVLTGALISVVGKAVLGRPATLAETWAEVRGRLRSLIGLALLTGLLTFGSIAAGVLLAVLLYFVAGPVSLIVGIPLGFVGLAAGVYLYNRLSLAPAALVLEKAGIREAMRRSGTLVARSWWRVFGIQLLTRVIASFVGGILTVPLAIIGFVVLFLVNEPSSGGFVVLAVVMQVGAGLVSVLVAPFEAGVRALLYVDQRMRAEGLDLTLQAAASAPAPSPSPA